MQNQKIKFIIIDEVIEKLQEIPEPKIEIFVTASESQVKNIPIDINYEIKLSSLYNPKSQRRFSYNGQYSSENIIRTELKNDIEKLLDLKYFPFVKYKGKKEISILEEADYVTIDNYDINEIKELALFNISKCLKDLNELPVLNN